MNYDNYFVLYLFIFAVVPDDDQLSQHEQDNIPPRSCTPPSGEGCQLTSFANTMLLH